MSEENRSRQPTSPISLVDLIGEVVFKTSRSSGPGGQHANKVSSRVTLQFDIANSRILTPEQKVMLLQRLASRVTSEGVLPITVQETRSQSTNKDIALQKFAELLQKAFRKRKVRKATKPTKSAKRERLKKKKIVSEKKRWRKPPEE